MNIKAAFPSKWLKECDIDGKDITLTIESVSVQDLGGNDDPKDIKPVVYFRGAKKGLGLNKTNSGTIADMYGDETDDWIGKRITLQSAMTEMQGKRMKCIRISPDKPLGDPAPAAATTSTGNTGMPVDEEEIPF